MTGRRPGAAHLRPPSRGRAPAPGTAGEICHAAAGVAMEVRVARGGGRLSRRAFQARRTPAGGGFRRHAVFRRRCRTRACAPACRQPAGSGRCRHCRIGAAPAAPAADPTVAARQALREAAARARQSPARRCAHASSARPPRRPGRQPAGPLQPMLANALTEKAAINFLNDLVAFYLVKVHWELISQRWLKNPVKHADAWLTVFYLMFLLVRYRKSIAAPVVVKPGEPATPREARPRRPSPAAPPAPAGSGAGEAARALLHPRNPAAQARRGEACEERAADRLGDGSFRPGGSPLGGGDPVALPEERLLAVVDAVIGNIAAAPKRRHAEQCQRRLLKTQA
jgi:hypothetical protein